MQRTTRGRTRPRIEPIRTDHGHFNGLSKRLIPVRGDPSSSPQASLSPPPAEANPANSAISPFNTSLSTPLSASFFARGGIQPDVYVIPVELPKRLRPAVKSNTRNGELISPIPERGHYTVRVVVHSGNNRHFGLTRQFDVDALRATIPDSISPRTPVLDKSLSLAILEGRSISPLPKSLVKAEVQRDPGDATSPDSGGSPLSEREARLGYRALPMDRHFARAHLPTLSAIIMSNKVRRGNTIELPMPHPEAWKSTIMHIHTGNPEFASVEAKRNILYLGGRV